MMARGRKCDLGIYGGGCGVDAVVGFSDQVSLDLRLGNGSVRTNHVPHQDWATYLVILVGAHGRACLYPLPPSTATSLVQNTWKTTSFTPAGSHSCPLPLPPPALCPLPLSTCWSTGRHSPSSRKIQDHANRFQAHTPGAPDFTCHCSLCPATALFHSKLFPASGPPCLLVPGPRILLLYVSARPFLAQTLLPSLS